MGRLLVVEDDNEYRAYLVRFLQTLGFEPLAVADAEAGFESAVKEQPRLLFADWCLHGRSGLDLVRSLRADARTKHLPIVMMSSIKETIEDEYRALDAGADLFFVKDELRPGGDKGATLKRHLTALILLGAKRAARMGQGDKNVYHVGSLRLDPARAEASVAGRPIRLGRKEFELLEFFLRYPGVIHSPEKIWRCVWDAPSAGNWKHTLAATLSSLRKVLGFEWSARLVNTKTLGYSLLYTGSRSAPNLSRPD